MNILEHLYQHKLVPLTLFGVDISITNGVITLWTAAALILLFFALASWRARLIPGRLQNLAETIILFVRQELAGMITHDRQAWLPFLTVLFLFILANNLVGLVPTFSGVTGNINTTAVLALIIFVVVHVSGIIRQGLGKYLINQMPSGLPWPIFVLMIPIEIVSQLAKPFSLALRLFANMFAGHALLLILLSLIFVFKSYLILPLPLAGDIVFLGFEVFVAFIQAFVFTYLSALYIATAQEGH
ncbi:ATP synthase F0 subunit A [candidate division WOR-1 bacterium RIFOXYB2_FULL_48_7]|uniref:ATP synthase subunit a n=1 Tax=candidate division WOR-1 bacterium RIFOXYB2_FULL_48_7 TaxID=1802583 RepID=A0A1F4TIQ8_UNCSA|nr:MAG: ATP synthase F0 subunit A [candidate division WOR-1 bacterium RIFOXYB2_FULL_48_7]